MLKKQVENRTEHDITLGKGYSFGDWIYENNFESNASELFAFRALNPDYSTTFPAGEAQEIILTNEIWETYVSREALLSSESKLIYSYYPDKKYILFETEDYIHEVESSE